MLNRRKLVKNAAANLTRGGAVGLVTVLLPPFLVRHMPSTIYAVWILVLQTAAYASYLDFGLQTAVGRYIAFSSERNDLKQRNTIFSTAYLGLLAVALLNILLVLAIVGWVPHVFPAVPSALIPEMRWALLIVGISVALGLPASAWNGVFIGLQRNEIPALTTISAKLLMAVAMVFAVYLQAPLIVLATTVAASNVIAYATQYALFKRFVPDLKFSLAWVRRSAAGELFHYCAALTVMSLSMLLINGIDLLLVGRFDFRAVIPYSVAASIIPLFTGALFAVLNAMMPQAAALHARGEAVQLGETVIASTRLGSLLLMLTGLPILIFAGPLLRIWIGSQYVAPGEGILKVLVIANIIRLIGGAYGIVLVAAGQQGLIKISPISEGVTNFLASVALGATLGGIGVAYGTLIGSIVSIGSHLVYSMPRTRAAIGFSRRKYLLSGIGLPLLCTSPLLAEATMSMMRIHVGIPQFVAAAILSLAAVAFLLNHHHRVPTSLPAA